MTILILTLAIAWLVFSYLRPRESILWFPLLLPTYVFRTHLGPVPTTLLELCFVGTMIAFIFSSFPRRRETSTDKESKQNSFFTFSRNWIPACTGMTGSACLWLFCTLLAVFIAPNHLTAFGLWRAYVLEPILFALLAISTIKSKDDRETMIHAFGISTILVVTYSAIQFLTNQIHAPWNTASWLTRRATGPYPFPNAIALYVTPIAALFSARWIESRKKFDGTIVIIGLLGIILAKSVGGFLGLLGTTIFFTWQRPPARKLLLAIATFALLAIVIVTPLRSKVISTLSFNEWSGKVRLITWRESLTMLKDHPIFGAGFGGYKEAMIPYHHATAIEIFQYPHNIFLNLWTETGLLGLLAFFWLLIAAIKQRSSIFFAPLLAIMIHGLVDVPYFKNDLAFAFLLFIVLLKSDT